MTARQLDSYLHSAPQLQTLLRHAEQLGALQRRLEGLLPPPLAAACRAGDLRQHTLTIHAANGAAAAKLKQLLPRLLDRLNQQGAGISLIRVEVRACFAPPPQQPPAGLSSPGPAALASLGALEQRLPESPLKEALSRMVERHLDTGGSKNRRGS